MVLVTSESVTPAIAETTTTGREFRNDRTMVATFLKAATSATDVPPNFIMVVIIKKRPVAMNTTDLTIEFATDRHHH